MCNIYYRLEYRRDMSQVLHITGLGVIDLSIYNKVYEMQEPDMSRCHLLAELGFHN